MDIEINNQLIIFGAIFLVINIISLVYMMMDKNRAFQNHRRVPEGNLFFLSICFGSLGIFLGMYLFRHKTRKWYFLVGVPLSLAQNIIFIWFVSRAFS